MFNMHKYKRTWVSKLAACDIGTKRQWTAQLIARYTGRIIDEISTMQGLVLSITGWRIADAHDIELMFQGQNYEMVQVHVILHI